MPQRSNTRKVMSPKVQGKDSFVEFRKITYGESKALRLEAKAHKDDEEWQMSSSEALLTDHIVDWNWVDGEGKPLPLPKDDPTVIEILNDDEITFLTDLVRGNTDPKRGNTDPK